MIDWTSRDVTIIHHAGALVDGLQRCTRCGYVLSDYRHAMVPDGDPPLVGWQVGASVEVEAGNPRFSSVTDNPPNCKDRGR